MIFWAVVLKPIAGSVEFALPGTEHSQLLPTPLVGVVLPRLVSASARSKQYSHCASAVALPSGTNGGVFGKRTSSNPAGIWPVITVADVCSWPATTDSMPMNSGRSLSADRYSSTGYWNSWIDCQRHILRFGLLTGSGFVGLKGGFGSPLILALPMLAAHVVLGP